MSIITSRADAIRERIRPIQAWRRVARLVLPFGAPVRDAHTRSVKDRLVALAENGLVRFLCGLGAAGVIATFSLSVSASPLSDASFNRLASSCAPGIELPTLRAVAAVESHFEPWAIRDNATREAWEPRSLAAATALAQDRLRKGHSVDLGLMQINSANFVSLGIGLSDAFDPCRSLAAANRILLGDLAAGSSEAERQAAILITLSRYNTGRPLAGIINGYATQVIEAQRAASGENSAQQTAQNTSPSWDIWGAMGAEPTSWLITPDGSSAIERAGAQSTDARVQEHAVASPAKKGEPYEIPAYQETAPNRP